MSDRDYLRRQFTAFQGKLAAELAGTRQSIDHHGDMGGESESHWVEMLTHYLPARYNVHRGKVIDADGNRSDSIDIIIHDRHFSPFILNGRTTTHVPAESVYAVLEVKQGIDAANLRYAGDKAASVRRLRRTSAPITHLTGKNIKEMPPILAGIVATEAEWAEPFGTTFLQALSALQGDCRLDFGCAVSHGAFEQVGDDVRVAGPEFALASFFLTLLERLQQLGSVPAMDIGAYRAALDDA